MKEFLARRPSKWHPIYYSGMQGEIDKTELAFSLGPTPTARKSD